MLLLVTAVNAQNVNEVNIQKLINATIFKQPTINASIENSTNKNVASGMVGTMFNQSSVCINQSVGGCYWEMDVPASSQAYVEWTKKGSQVLINNPDTNLSACGWFNITSKASGYRKFLDSTDANANSRGIEFYWTGADQGDQLNVVIYPQTGSSEFSRVQPNGFPTNVWQSVCWNWNDTVSLLYVFINGTIVGQSGSITAGGGPNIQSIIRLGWDYTPATENREFEGIAQCFTIFNQTLNSSEIAKLSSKYYCLPDAEQTTGAEPDTSPPEINQNSYNMTSEGGEGCINWRTGETNQCSTSDTTPTVEFTTNEPAFCAIDISNVNYTIMGISRNCTIGEGTASHACTLTVQDELVYEDSTMHISCKDSNNNQNSTSTSGALSLTITSLETGGDAAIGVGIQNALLSGYTNYTNQQIYARKLDNTQDFGTFDWVAKKGSKVWAFNYITKGEEHVGMFNLTPVLYVLEMSNITNTSIINRVEIMINATK